MLKIFNRKKKDNKGFTLVELVIVIAILAILVGLLAPQYTKYVEKTRKTADANNMNELVKVVQVYAGDPVNELAAATYTITIGATADKTGISTNAPAALITELGNSVPDWKSLKTKSQKWSDTGAAADISASITVDKDGGISITYLTKTFADFVGGKVTPSSTPAPGAGNDNTQQG